MKKLLLIYFSSVLLTSCQHSQVAPEKTPPLITADSKYGILKGDSRIDRVEIIIVPQWHLSPKIDTKINPQQQLPQTQNQMAIYNQVSEWAQNGQIKSVVVEGCEGEIKDGFTSAFNGWTLADLQKEEDINDIVTHVGLKLKAKFPNLRVICGDNLDLIDKNQLAFSDLRGLLGFKLRIEQFKTQPDKQEEYLKAAKETLKLPEDATGADVLKTIDSELRKSLNDFKSYIKERDDVFVKTTLAVEKPTAIVIGAVHASDLREKLKGKEVLTFEPEGLKGDEEQLIQQLEKKLSK